MSVNQSSSFLKMDGQKTTLLLGRSIFRCEKIFLGMAFFFSDSTGQESLTGTFRSSKNFVIRLTKALYWLCLELLDNS